MEEFRSESEELLRVLAELEETKRQVRELATRLGSTEKHLRRVFRVPRPSRPAVKAASAAQLGTLGREQLLELFDKLRATHVDAPDGDSERALEALPEPEVRALAWELGITGGRSLSIRKARLAILAKLRESALLGQGALRSKNSPESQTPEGSPEPTPEAP